MEINDFYSQFIQEINEKVVAAQDDGISPDYDAVFCEIMGEYMEQESICVGTPQLISFEGKINRSNLHVSGYAMDEEDGRLDLFVSIFEPTKADELFKVTKQEVEKAAKACGNFISECSNGTLCKRMDAGHRAMNFAELIQKNWKSFFQVRIFVLTNGLASVHNYTPVTYNGTEIRVEVVDFQRYFNHQQSGNSRSEVSIDFERPLSCIYQQGSHGYDYALAVVPAQVLYDIYDNYGDRVLEANVRSFLSFKRKSVNAGIRSTMISEPSNFLAYNNGLVIVVDGCAVDASVDGVGKIRRLEGLQIVNGGQTTASIFFAKKDNKKLDLSEVNIPAKIIVLNTEKNEEKIEERAKFLGKIAQYANSQNAIKASQLQSNDEFHVQMEKLANATYLPNGLSKWYYERTTGSYNVWLRRAAKTDTERRKLREKVPPSRKVTLINFAKYIMAWRGEPDIASLGSQKNFARFNELTKTDPQFKQLDQNTFKKFMSIVIFNNQIIRQCRKEFKAFKGNIAIYTTSIFSQYIQGRFNYEAVWSAQGLSDNLNDLLIDLARVVEKKLYETANGRMISEWCKKGECWNSMREVDWKSVIDGIIDKRKYSEIL